MTNSLKAPEFGAPLPACIPSEAAVDMLWRRRSTPADLMSGPGPCEEQLDAILTIAARVPDHRRVTPFRFVVFENDARERFGERLAKTFAADNPDADIERVEKERRRFMRAAVVIAVISSPNPDHKTPVWEQHLTAGAVCQNMLLAASAFGFAAQWLTEWYAFHAGISKQIGLRNEHEQIAGFIYIGSASEDPRERARPDVDAITERY